MQTIWNQTGNIFMIGSESNNVPKLPVGIHHVCENDMIGIFLQKLHDKFEFPYKIYGMETSFVNRVVKTYKNTNHNLGLLLNGIKGTGKTVTAELICNALELPVIMVTANHRGISQFINKIQQDVVVLIDEYEKIYSNYNDDLLTVMDGVLNNGYRRIFILTTNSPHVNQNMIQRPGRLRYIKTYGDLSLEVIEEIVDDILIHKHLRAETIKYISTLQIITVDIIKAIISEVNIHEEAPQEFATIFNTKVVANKWDVYEKIGTELVALHKGTSVNPGRFTEEIIHGYTLNADGESYGYIKEWENIEDDIHEIVTTFTTEEYDKNGDEIPGTEKTVKRKFRISPAEVTHKAFNKYVF